MTEIGNVTLKVDAVITDEQYHEAMSAVSAANERMAELQAENAKLRELFNETLIRLVAASEATGGGFMDDQYCELLESNGIEVME